MAGRYPHGGTTKRADDCPAAAAGITERMSKPTDEPDGAGGDRVERRAAGLLPEEAKGGSDDPEAQAKSILDESDERSADRNAAPDSVVEHRDSDETVAPGNEDEPPG